MRSCWRMSENVPRTVGSICCEGLLTRVPTDGGLIILLIWIFLLFNAFKICLHSPPYSIWRNSFLTAANVLGGGGSFDKISTCPLERKDRKQNVKANLNACPSHGSLPQRKCHIPHIGYVRWGKGILIFICLFIGPKSDHCLALKVTLSVPLLNFVQIVGFIKVVTWIYRSC